MSTIVTRAGKGSPLTNTEADANITNLNTDKVEKSGDTLTGDLAFGDNVKAKFGASDDLEIYHTGTNSIINEVGAGNLVLSTNGTQVRIAHSTNAETMAEFNKNGSALLKYDGANKLETTSSGVDVTGTVTADDEIIVDGASGAQVTIRDTGRNGLQLSQNNTGGGFINLVDASENLHIRTQSTNNIRIQSSGDISFYDDSGSSQDLYWDASTSRLGIGTTSPSAKLHLDSGTSTELLRIDHTYAGTAPALILNNQSGNASAGSRISFRNNDTEECAIEWENGSGTSSSLRFHSNNSERMRIDSNGRLGIGTTSPATNLDVEGTVRATTGSEYTELKYYGVEFNRSLSYIRPDTDGTKDLYIGYNGVNKAWRDLVLDADRAIVFNANASEAARIDSSGRLLIGRTTGTSKLYVSGTSADIAINDSSGTYNYRQTTLKVAGDRFLLQTRNGDGTFVSQDYIVDKGASGATSHQWLIDASEAARIDSSSNLLVGGTNAFPSSNNVVGSALKSDGQGQFSRDGGTALNLNRKTSDGDIAEFRKDGSAVGSISTSGGTTSYNTTSDYRLKENVTNLDDASDRLSQLQVKRFNLIGRDQTVDGFLAHEVQDVVPEAVTGSKDEVDSDGNPIHQSIDHSKLVPLLTASLQEALTRIESLENQISNLTGGS